MKHGPEAQDNSVNLAAVRARIDSAPSRGFVRLNEPAKGATQGFRTPSDAAHSLHRTFTPLSTVEENNQAKNKEAGREGLKKGREAEQRFVKSALRVLLSLAYDSKIEQSGELDAKKVDTRVHWRRDPEEPWETTDVQVSVGEKSKKQQERLERDGITPVIMPEGEPDEETDARLRLLFKANN
jgi:hypothetical protein